jgi:hypothetical protein
MLRQNFGARLPTSLIREAWVKLAGNALEEDLNGWCAAFLMCQTEYRRLKNPTCGLALPACPGFQNNSTKSEKGFLD